MRRAAPALACLALTGALHLAAWAAIHAAPPPARTAAHAPSVSVRVAAIAEPGWQLAASAASAAVAVPQARGARALSPAPQAEAAPEPQPVAEPPAAADAMAEPPEGPEYLPRPWLSVAPAPLEPVALDYPALEGDTGWHHAVLALFIDETGAVQRVRVEDSELPALLEEAARKAFMAARFQPGEIDGVAVRSRLRVEVQFDSRQR